MPLPASPPSTPGSEITADRFALEALEFQSVRDLLLRMLVSPLGRRLVEEARPLDGLPAVAAALAEVGEMAALLRRGERVPLSGFLDVRPWLASIVRESHLPEGKELADLRKVLSAAGRVRAFFLALPEAESPRLFAMGDAAPDLEPLVAELERTVDAAGKVLSTASPRLGRLRDEVAQADAALHAAIERVLGDPELRRLLQSPGISWRNERPVVQVKLEWGRRVPGILHDRSQSGSTLFIEPEALVEKANELQNRRASEAREVQLVLVEAARKVRAELHRIEDCLLLLARVDYCQARARLTTEMGFSVPAVSQRGPLRLRRARHPILLLSRAAPEDIVPLDLDLGDAHRLLVVTGPNTGGKTVTLKTVGLLAAMALSGIPVPAAAGTEFPLLDGVFVDIGDEQEIAQNLSTFSSHVQRIAGCLERATEASLVLLDELGAGTDPEEGGALGWAILEELQKRRCLTIASTHLGRLKEFAYQHEGVENGSMAFDPMTLAPLYRLEIGLPGTSNALHVARVVGLSAGLVERARSLLGKRDRVVEDMIDSIQLTRMAAEEDRKRSEQTVRELAGAREALRIEQEELERRRGWLQEEADHLVDEELKAARSLLAMPLREFRNAPQPYGEKARELLEALDFILGRSPLARRRLKYIGTLKKGDIVYVPRYRRRCVVQKVDRTRNRILVAMGDLRAEIAYEEVSWLQPLAE